PLSSFYTLSLHDALPILVGLFFAAAAGGAINAVAGGGTLVTFPTLLLFGTPPIVANATSTLALVLGTSGSLYGYRQHLPAVRSRSEEHTSELQSPDHLVC